MVAGNTVEAITSYLAALPTVGVRPEFAVLFGSQAREEHGQWSDIDLVIVSTTFDGIPDRERILALWRLAARVDCRIEPIACGLSEWLGDDARPIIEIARKQGLLFKPAD